jgi:hypothetical protein
MNKICTQRTESGIWILYDDEIDKVINVVLMRNNTPIFLIEQPEFYDCPDFMLNAVSKKVLNQVSRWLHKRYCLQEDLPYE